MYVVYCHTNRVTLKSYVGYTKFSLEERWAGHVFAAEKGKHHAFPSAIRKYGVDVWEHIELEKHRSLVSTKDAEIFFIAYLQTLTPNGYNMTRGGDGASGDLISRLTKTAMWRPDVRARHLEAQGSELTRRLHKESTSASWKDPAMRANHRTGWESSTKVKRHAIVQINMSTQETISTFVSVSEASRSTRIHKSSILNQLHGYQKHAGGFVWRYLKC